MPKFISQSAKETKLFAQKLGASLSKATVFALEGDLGAGKTVFAKGLAKGLGVKAVVNSPTFNILKLYKISGHKTLKYFCHVDAYRLGSAHDLAAIGINDFFSDKETVILIEWAEKIRKILPNVTRLVKIKHLRDNLREIKY